MVNEYRGRFVSKRYFIGDDELTMYDATAKDRGPNPELFDVLDKQAFQKINYLHFFKNLRKMNKPKDRAFISSKDGLTIILNPLKDDLLNLDDFLTHQ